MSTPNPERQIHRACGDLRLALVSALELLSDTTVPRAGHDDVFRAFSDLGRIQHHVALALQATNLLDQMVGTPAEQRLPWSYYRDRIRRKHASCPESLVDDCGTASFGSSRIDEGAYRPARGGPDMLAAS